MSSNTITLTPIYLPTQISSCVLWLDGADPFANGILPTNGSTIGTWKNKGTSAINIVNSGSPTFSNAIINSNGAVRFPGSAYLQDTGFIHTLSNKTYFLVTQGIDSTNPTTQGIMYFGNNGFVYNTQNGIAYQGPESAYNNQFGFLQAFGNGGYYYSFGSSYANTPLGIYGDTCSNTSASIYVNGSNLSNFTLSYTPQNSTGFRMGRRVDSLGQYYNGYICEVLAFNTLLNTSQRQQTEGYLAWKWGLQTSLPSNHPYKNTPVYTPNTLPPQFRSNLASIPFAQSLSPFSFFRPTSISNCALWLDAADRNSITSSGSTVTAWADKSPNNVTLTLSNGAGGSTVLSTYLNLPVVQFSNSCLYNASFSYPLASRSIFLVLAEIVHQFYRGFIGFSSNGQSDYNTSNGYVITSTGFTGSNIEFSQNQGNGGFVYRMDTGNASLTTPFGLYEDVTSGTSVNIYNAGSNAYSTTTSVTPSPSLGVTIAGRGLGPSLGSMIVAEILCYNVAVTAGQRQQIEGYLAWKWNLIANLPSTHPYKNAPPGLPVPSVPLRLTMANRFFQPTNIAGCALWFDGMDINGNGTSFTNGASVNTWVDKSGNGRNATGTVAATYDSTGKYVNFTGTNYYSLASNAGSFVVNSYFSFFWVERLQASAASISRAFMGTDSTGTNQGLHMAYYGTTPMRFGFFANDLDCFPAAFVSAGSQPIRIWSFVFNPSFRAIYLNGAIQSSDANNTQLTAWATPLIGRAFSGNNYIGFMYEILGYGGQIQTAQRQNIEGYLAWKWGLQDNLPSNHPWKKWPPPPS